MEKIAPEVEPVAQIGPLSAAARPMWGAVAGRRWYRLLRGRAVRALRRRTATPGVAPRGVRPPHARNEREAGRQEAPTVATEIRRALGATASASAGSDPVVLWLVVRSSDGERVLRALRRQGLTGPILVETADDVGLEKTQARRRGKNPSAVNGANSSAPPPAAEPAARRPSTSEATGAEERLPPAYFGDVVVDPSARAVLRRGTPVGLTALEFDLLLALLRRRGGVASRRELLRDVWGRGVSSTSRTVDAHIYKLRRKLENDPAVPRHILTVQKAGYRLQV